MNWRQWAPGLIVLGALQAPLAWAQEAAVPALHEVLAELNRASLGQSYQGTMVVSAGEHMMTAKVWHACEGQQQHERVENLNGRKRITWRHNDTVTTVWPNQRRAVSRRFVDLGMFPAALQVPPQRMAQHYAVQPLPAQRVAGRQAKGLRLQAKDAHRFSYNLLVDAETGVVLKLQTVAPNGAMLEQTAYSDIAFDNALATQAHARLPPLPEGTVLTTERSEPVDPARMGWRLSQPVEGFQALRAYRLARTAPGSDALVPAPVWQWLFSDGLASISLVIDQDNPNPPAGRPDQPVAVQQGATFSYAQQVGAARVTAVGDAPLPTLRAMVEALQRVPLAAASAGTLK